MSSMEIAEIIIVPFTIVVVSYFFQKRTQKEIQRQGAQFQEKLEELRDKLAKERFLEEKHWNEARSLYENLSGLFQEVWMLMNRFEKLLFSNESLFSPKQLFYIHLRMQGLPVMNQLIEDLGTTIKMIDSTLQPEHFGDLWLKMKEIQGSVTIFASTEIQEINDYLCSLTRKFADMVVGKLILLAAESKSKSDKYNDSAKNFFLAYQRTWGILSQPNEDIQPLLHDFRKKLQEMHQIMRKDLSSGSFLQKGRSET